MKEEEKNVKLRDNRKMEQPELMIIPMIDIMFFLLVFFMLSTMYMVDLKTIPLRLPKASNAVADTTATFAVSIKQDGSLWLEDQAVEINSLVMQAQMEQKNNPTFAVVIRADASVDYGQVVTLLDKLKGAGVQKFGLATDAGVGEG